MIFAPEASGAFFLQKKFFGLPCAEEFFTLPK